MLPVSMSRPPATVMGWVPRFRVKPQGEVSLLLLLLGLLLLLLPMPLPLGLRVLGMCDGATVGTAVGLLLLLLAPPLLP